ncbi:hypothetical protein JYU34_013070 [Plutella xylostella]|uniref:TMC domain-containing protein n=1 Tax=Plutella xylostella TaxID=51655 RepID=A0ABQ7QCU0_PLUXY|nr:hypothetical protein JYU34_013070 [Plutella xylostella]
MEEDSQELHHRPTGVRRAFTMRNSVARQAVSFMPSRQLPYNTLRQAHSEHNALLEDVVDGNTGSAEQQANIIVRELEQHELLMEDNPEAEELRREALRDLPQGLTMKRQVRAQLSASVSHRSSRRPLSFWQRTKYRVSFGWKRSRDRLRNFIFSIEPWYEAIRQIEGHSGSAVGAYFCSLRWLVAADLLLLVLLLSFVVVPQVLHDNYVVREEVPRSVMDFVGGQGMFSDSLLFYGHYHSGGVAAPGPRYYMPLAYLFTMLAAYVAMLCVLCYRTAKSYRQTFIVTGGGVRNVFANKVFSGWDCSVATEQAARLNHRSIYNELKELLVDVNKPVIVMTFLTKLWRYTVNTAVSLIVLALIGSIGYGTWSLLSLEVEHYYWPIAVSGIVTAIVTVCPLLFSAVVRLEYYSARTALYVTLARTCLLDFGTLFLIFYFWATSDKSCWETTFGQETYRLVLLDAVFSLILLPAFEFIRGLVYKYQPKGSPPEFNIAYNSLTLIYNQTVLWFGMLFSPLLVVAVTVKFLLLFYVKKTVAMKACLPARKVWRAAQTETVMYMLVTVSLFVTLFGIGSLFMGKPSYHCGPFRGYTLVVEVVTEGVLGLSKNRRLSALLVFLTRPAVIGFIFVFLCIAVYYMRARSLAQRSMVDILRQMLVIEAKDKDFLLTAISKVSNGEWLYSPRDDTNIQDNSYTWKYLHDDKVRKPSNSGYQFAGPRLNHGETSRQQREDVKSFVKEEGDTDSEFSYRADPRGAVGGREWL